ncbi:MAG: uroporphyrinogen-III C-methyltransferase [Candidatus Eremiobacteraeota bacterium]|nr:uroporphyrinogen-III C-methyltransferase [Candidatus Eremiobacteraeota bacterium]
MRACSTSSSTWGPWPSCVSSSAGTVYLVGAGPGDPGLLTLRGAQLLCAADVLLYDALVSDAIVAMARPTCERIFVGKRGRAHATPQEEIEALMIAKARDGHAVVRLKGGDPFVFGRGGEEAEALSAAGVDYEIVPGVTSAIAAPAYAGIPLTHRRHAASFTVATGHEDPAKSESTVDWSKIADPHRTLVLLMATATLREIAGQLIAAGMPETMPAALIQDGTRPTQRTIVTSLQNLADKAHEAAIAAPAVAVIGRVVALRDRLAWFERRPLFGKRVLITRAGHQSEEFARALLARGAQPLNAPTIEIRRERGGRVEMQSLGFYAWVVFTSQNGVDAFFASLDEQQADARTLHGARVAAIGAATAARLRHFGVRADLVAPAFVAEELASALIANSSAGDRMLLYRAIGGRDVLPETLRNGGRDVTEMAGYSTDVPADDAFAPKVRDADVLTFTSASTVRGFVTLLGVPAHEAVRGKCVACIGPITARAAHDAGLNVDVVAQHYTTAGLLAALEAHFASRPR